MYKIHGVKIDNFWHRFNAVGEFNEDVNIIIGRNGTGKTTFMNILHSVLAVDLDGISSNDFDSVAITLIKGNKKKTVKVEKIETDSPFLNVVYRISNKKYFVRVLSSEDHRMVSHYRRRAIEESDEVRVALANLVSLSSLSVYRLRSGQDYEVRDKHGRRAVSPVDYRLLELLQSLTHYQLELSQQANSIATELQRDVLTSILYTEEKSSQQRIPMEFDKRVEKQNLISAYTQLNVIDAGVRKKINIHADAIDNTVRKFKAYTQNPKNDTAVEIDFQSIEALVQTRKIIKMSLDAEKRTSVIFSQITLFTETLSEFITDKKFSFHRGDLLIEAHDDVMSYDALSSGEKQLLIIFIETLLQKKERFIFLTDEPELSLHIAWQRKIIPAVKKLNPNAQIIAATHSPEVASNYKDSIIDMEEMING